MVDGEFVENLVTHPEHNYPRFLEEFRFVFKELKGCETKDSENKSFYIVLATVEVISELAELSLASSELRSTADISAHINSGLIFF